MKERMITGAIFALVMLSAIWVGGWLFSGLMITAALIGIREIAQMNRNRPNKRLMMVLSLYVAFGFVALIMIRMEHHVMFTLWIIISMWVADSGAYITGRKWGKTKLAPTISPNKTWEGLIGGIVCALAVAVLIQLWYPVTGSMVYTLILTMFISVGGQCGDLLESKVKRYYSVKDSGKILPGHGGIFDRFDSLIFVVLILWIALYF